MTTGVVFPGQGAQSPRMGVPWRDHPAWSVVERAEEALGESVGRLLLGDDPPERTRDAQLAVLLASLVAWEAARPLLGPPVAFAGHSLGQVTALVAAGALDLEDGVRFAARRADVTQAAADRRPGRMVALLGASDEQVSAARAAGEGECWTANDNAPGQVVLAGTPEGVSRATEAARAAGVRKVVPLRVGGAFHTPLMDEARAALCPALATLALATTSSPVVSNGDARPYTDGDGWRMRLADHLVRPVRWRQSLLTMADLGAEEFVEIGPGQVLAGMVRRTVPGARVRNIATPSDVELSLEVRS